jgi:succinate dehydrogenase / fumarate reductase cytochrome b subunit
MSDSPNGRGSGAYPGGFKRVAVVESLDRWFRRNHFALRRLHSLMGIIPIGAFLIEHLLTNSLAWFGPEKFNEQVHWLHNLHYLLALEILFIFLPLLFHGGYGLVIAWQARLNPEQYPYMDNWRYTLQRVTAWIVVVFILVHLAHFRFAHWFGGEPYPGTPDPFDLTQRGFLGLLLPNWLWIIIYSVGLTAAAYHFTNGIVTFCITWGITVSVASRQRMSILAAAAFLVLMAWGILSLWGLQRIPAEPDPASDRTMQVASPPVGSPTLDT